MPGVQVRLLPKSSTCSGLIFSVVCNSFGTDGSVLFLRPMLNFYSISHMIYPFWSNLDTDYYFSPACSHKKCYMMSVFKMPKLEPQSINHFASRQ